MKSHIAGRYRATEEGRGGRRLRARAPTELAWFTPLPPARNGIADYSFKLLEAMRAIRPSVAYSPDGLAVVPKGVAVRDAAQAFRDLGAGRPILHHVGNNGDHVFVLDALRQHGGVVCLHDLGLLYLYEMANRRIEPIIARMQAQHRGLGTVYGRHWSEDRLKTEANYVLFDLVGEILSLADGVIVHSRYGLNKLRATYGEAAVEHVRVIPHFAPPFPDLDRAAIRERLGVAGDEILILTSGFATKAKRFDWAVEALRELAERGLRFRWVHAGEERPSEFPLRDAIAAAPALAGATTVTGYLREDELDSYILAADLLLNLRFPSVGESSGTLARAFAAGRCCIVNDTAAYAELPRDAVVHVPTFGAVPALVRALDGLISDAGLRAAFGARARAHAEHALSIDRIAAEFSTVIDEFTARRSAAPERLAKWAAPSSTARTVIEIEASSGLDDMRASLASMSGPFDAVLWFRSAAEIARRSLDVPGFLSELLGPAVEIENIGFYPSQASRAAILRERTERVGLRVSGRAFAA